MLAAMDFSTRANALANWIALPATTPNATPADRFFGFAHQRDEMINYTILSTRAWPAYGMSSYGGIVNVDQASPSYNNSHSLNSNLEIPGGFFHGAIVADPRLVRQPDGVPIYRPVWEYLLAAPRLATTVSAASYQTGLLAPESIVSVFGLNLTSATMSNTTLPLPTILAGTSVRVLDSQGSERLAPLFFVSPTQINLQLPPLTSKGMASLSIINSDGTTSVSTVQIGDLSPGMFTADGSGQGVPAGYALRVKPDGTQVYEAIARFDSAQSRFIPVPIDLSNGNDQVFLVLFGTGWRRRSSLSGAVLRAGGTDLPVVYLGPHSDLVGLDQLNALLPRNLAGRGQIELSLIVEGLSANTLRVSFR
jgi:uncharacterized protein (TIGR03437 family)